MSKRIGFLLCLALAACNGGTGQGTDVTAALLRADEAREGCVAATLDMMQGVVDLFAPAVTVRDLDELTGLMLEAGCTLVVDTGGTDHVLSCPGIMVRGEPVALLARLTYLARGAPVADPAAADSVAVFVEAVDGPLRIEATLELAFDPIRGVVVDGGLFGDAADGCVIDGTLQNVTVRTVADLPGVGTGALFTSGNVDLGLTFADAVAATGTAALAGRSALVALEINGIFSQGELFLGQ